MIRVNLIPGAKKARRGAGASKPFAGAGALLAAAVARIKDPYLVGAIVSVVLATLFVGATHLRQAARASAVAERRERATGDSVRFALLLRERSTAIAQRDSVARQLQIIRSIDSDRFVWAHVMDEVSRALPPYTWLTSVEQSSAPPPSAAAVTPADTGAKGKGKSKKGADPAPAAPVPVLRMHIVGNTVDIQALTRFMKDLEASPFVQNVTLNKTALIAVEQREVTEFELDCEYQKPDPAALRTVAVSLQAR